LLFDAHEKAQETVDALPNIVKVYGVRFAPSKCKVMQLDYRANSSTLTVQGEVLEIVDRFTYLGSSISNDASVSDEINARITKARLAFSNLRHLWRQKGVSLELKARVYNTTVRPVLLYGCETWLLRAEDLRRLEVFDHRCLRSIAGIGWHNRISNTQVRKRVFGNKGESHSLANLTRVNKLEWLGHVLRTPSHRLARRALFARPHHSWRRPTEGQALIWQQQLIF